MEENKEMSIPGYAFFLITGKEVFVLCFSKARVLYLEPKNKIINFPNTLVNWNSDITSMLHNWRSMNVALKYYDNIDSGLNLSGKSIKELEEGSVDISDDNIEDLEYILSSLIPLKVKQFKNRIELDE